jgi:gas vesicle protein GvpO
VAESTEPRRKRAEARERRRSRTKPDQDEGSDSLVEGNGGDEQPLESVKQAAKVAAAGAAVGAAAAAARVLASRSGDDHEPEAKDQAEMPTETQEEPQDSEAEDEAEQGPKADQEPQEPQEPEHSDRSDDEPEEERPAAREHRRANGIRGATADDAKATVDRAREQLEALLERPVESVSTFERTDDGWLVTLEVVEVSRVPESTDVLASYEMELDEDRNLRRYGRVHRYQRSQADRVEQR